jgi:predicted nucleic acid-binding protein
LRPGAHEDRGRHVDAEKLAAVAERHGLTSYDAAYLCVAEQLAAPLATFDERLGEAARVHLS